MSGAQLDDARGAVFLSAPAEKDGTSDGRRGGVLRARNRQGGGATFEVILPLAPSGEVEPRTDP